MAEVIHLQHKRDLLASLTDPNKPSDPALWEWDDLNSCEIGLTLKESSRESARDMARKLRLIGYEMHPSDHPASAVNSLSDQDYEELAEMEHPRWMMERLGS